MSKRANLVMNKQTSHVYEIVSSGESSVKLCRIGDRQLVEVFPDFWAERYRALTDGEYKLLKTVIESAVNQRRWVMIYNNRASLGSDHSFLKALSDEAPSAIADAQGTTVSPAEPQKKQEGKAPEVPDFKIHSFSRLMLSKSVKESIEVGLKKIELRDLLYNKWNMKSIDPNQQRSAMNFYGPPGTGKTAAAMAIGARMNKPVLKVDYSECVSKYLGETGKNIKNAFADAKKFGAILFFDEADALLSQRLSATSSIEQSMNSDKAILLQEMDSFDGIVIFTTNFFGNYDQAAVRRIAAHVEFTLPEESMMRDIYQAHIPAEVPSAKIDWDAISKASVGLSGGDIKNITMNAIIAAAMKTKKNQQKLSTELLMNAVQAVKTAKNQDKQVEKRISIAG